ncbi:hypothetical protein NL676_012867 [Syzygium grande]|nr:hypothetical protein NL676_012867 [Syzygium grande]
MTDAADDIVEEISFQNFDDGFELLDSLVDDVLWGEVRDKFMEKKSRGIEFRTKLGFEEDTQFIDWWQIAHISDAVEH